MIARGFIIFLTLAIGGGLIESFLARLYYSKLKKYKKYHFAFSRYIYLLLMPMLGALVSFFMEGSSILRVFVIFALCGPIFEWLTGHAYYAMVGQKLWTYHRYAITG